MKTLLLLTLLSGSGTKQQTLETFIAKNKSHSILLIASGKEACAEPLCLLSHTVGIPCYEMSIVTDKKFSEPGFHMLITTNGKTEHLKPSNMKKVKKD